MNGQKLIKKTAQDLAKKGFTRGGYSSADARCLVAALPKDCVTKDIVGYASGGRRRHSKYDEGYFFRSPRSDISTKELLSLARWRKKNAAFRRMSITSILKELLVISEEEMVALRVAFTISG